MNIEEIREYCLSKSNCEESLPFGPDTLVFKTENKIFLILPLNADNIQFNVKCNPERAIELREEYPCVIPGFHMNKKHWNTIIVDGSVKNALLKEWVDHSFKMVLKKK